MIVANSAAYREAHERSAIGFGAFARHVHAQFFGDGAPFVAADAEPHVSAGDERIEIPGGQQIAGNLLHGELVKTLVVVEGANQVIAIRPDVAAVVVMQTIGVGVARAIEPVAGSVFTKGRPSEQVVHQVLVGLG